LRPVTVITGASAGIGSAFARVFAEHGHETVLVARRLDRLDAVADAITAPSTEHGHPPPHTLAIDLLAAKGPERLMGELATRGLEPAILVNNAGFGLRGAARDLDRAQQLAMIDLNMRVPTDLSLRCVPSLKRHRGGIINMASISSYFPGPGMAIYFAGKAYVLSFTEALRQELKPLGIKVTAVCPGPVPTEFQALAGINLRLESCREIVMSKQPIDAFTELTELQVSVAREYDEVRAFVRSLAQVKPVIRNGVTSPVQTDFQVEAHFTARGLVLEQILQIILEGMRNTGQHGRARSASIKADS